LKVPESKETAITLHSFYAKKTSCFSFLVL